MIPKPPTTKVAPVKDSSNSAMAGDQLLQSFRQISMTDKSVREMAEAERSAIQLRRQQSKKAAKVCEICADELVEDIACLKTCGCEFHLQCLRPYFAV